MAPASFLRDRVRNGAVIATVALATGAAAAQQAPAVRLGRAAPCVVVEIAGRTAGALECAGARLDAAAKAAQRAAQAPNGQGIASATSADGVTGVANQTATRQRMGNSFGRSVTPQRPAPPVFTGLNGRPH